MYAALAVLNSFLEFAESEGISLDPMRLERLVVVSEGWHVALYGESLIDEPILAEEYGPIVETLHDRLLPLGMDKIVEPLANQVSRVEIVPTKDVEARRFLLQIWKTHRHYHGVALANMTVTADSPWSTTIKNHEGEDRPVIEKWLWASYYQAVE